MPDEKLLGSGEVNKGEDGKGIFNFRFEKGELKRRFNNFNCETGIYEILNEFILPKNWCIKTWSEISELKNSGASGKEAIICSLDSKVFVVVIPTNEELTIVRNFYQMAISK